MHSLLLASLDGSNLIHFLVHLIIFGCIFGLIWWLVDFCGLPAPFAKGIKIIIAIFAVLFFINELLSLDSGHGFISW